jgi:hypothetical protein
MGWLFIVAGAVGVGYHATEIQLDRAFDPELLAILLIRAFAFLCGIGLLRGSNSARWGAVAWMAYHVLLSIWHSPSELIAHGVLLALIAYTLFRPSASAYFRAGRTRSVVGQNARNPA